MRPIFTLIILLLLSSCASDPLVEVDVGHGARLSPLALALMTVVEESTRSSASCTTNKVALDSAQKALRKMKSSYLKGPLVLNGEILHSHTPIVMAALANDTSNIEKLLRDDAEPSPILLMILINFATNSTLNSALKAGVDPNLIFGPEIEEEERSGLIEAIQYSLFEEAVTLLKYGADINYLSPTGADALSTAIACKNQKTATYLINHGATITQHHRDAALKIGMQLK